MIRWKNALGCVALVGTTMFVTSHVVSKQGEKDMQAEMAKWMELAQPGPEHARLAKAEGMWTNESTCWMYPGAEPEISTSTAEIKSILGGRFMFEKTKGTFDMGGEPMEFEGWGFFGYDNFKKKHIFAWLDTMGTMIMFGEGTANAAGDEITYFSSMPDPMTGGKKEIKCVSKTTGNDKHTFEMSEKLADGSWHKNMQIAATRKR